MVDYQSRYRVYGLGYNHTIPRHPIPSYRDIYRENAPLLFRSRNPLSGICCDLIRGNTEEYVDLSASVSQTTQSNTDIIQNTGHDCREEVMREHTDPGLWEAKILTSGLNKTYDSLAGLHHKDRNQPGEKRSPDKLLYAMGNRGRAAGNFSFPRGLAINSDGDIYIADTQNHRIQVFNTCGVLKSHFGSRGRGNGQFIDPCGIGIMPNDDVVVAEKKNRRLQVLTSKGKHKFFVQLDCEPFCVACDSFYNIAVSTYTGEVELYRRGGKFVSRFRVTPLKEDDLDRKMAMCIAVNSKGEIIVSDSNENLIKFFNHKGDLLYKFQPISSQEGLGVGNTGICVTPLDQIVVADGLNHLVNVYTERGILLQQMYSPADEVGPIQTCALGPEGHFVAAEFSANGRHCLKIFRYRDCECHKNRPPSSKRSSRASSPVKAGSR